MNFKRRRRAVRLRNQLNYPLHFNPFVFSKIFLLWAAIGIIAGTYWIVLEALLHFLAQFQGLYVIPLMGVAGLLPLNIGITYKVFLSDILFKCVKACSSEWAFLLLFTLDSHKQLL